MGQVVDPLFVSLINGRAYAAVQAPRRNAGNTAYEWGTAGWLDVAQTWASAQTFGGNILSATDGGNAIGQSGGSRFTASFYGVEIATTSSPVTGELRVGNGTSAVRIGGALVWIGSNVTLGFSSGDPTSTAPDTALQRDGVAGVSLNDNGTTSNPYLAIQAKSSTTALRNRVQITTAAADNTDATRKYRFILSAYDTAAREVMRGEASGTAALIGFLGATAVVRQNITGAKGGNAALTSLLTALVNLGLITDSTT